MREGKQKGKTLYLAKIMLEETDADHALTMPEILARLEEYGLIAKRKSVYDDIDCLQEFGIDIRQEKRGRNTYYYVKNREFEEPELKLLVDAILSSRFITEKKSRELIEKLEHQTSKYQADFMRHQIIVAGRIKSMNESIYTVVDVIQNAIVKKRQMRFHYFRWNLDKKPEYSHDGAWSTVSPWALVWDDEKYYLVAYDDEAKILKHYRVDKMRNTQMLDEMSLGEKEFKKQDKAKYTLQRFSMFDGQDERVVLTCENRMINILVDRFGKDIPIMKVDEEHFETRVDVNVSAHFLGWIAALGSGVKISGPDKVVEDMKAFIQGLSDIYDKRK